MSKVNGGRPLPWHDNPICPDPKCSGPMVPVRFMANGFGGPGDSSIACAACGAGIRGDDQAVAQAERAQRAWDLRERGLIHEDRGCARCNGPLPRDHQRLCADCVVVDTAERQLPMFPASQRELPGQEVRRG